MTTSKEHQGYMDGINGVEPTVTAETDHVLNVEAYTNGWLAGTVARENGESLPEDWDSPRGFKQGDKVTIKRGTPVYHECGVNAGKVIPAKRTYQVEAVIVSKGYEAFREYGMTSEVRPPTPAYISYAGSGGYWRKVLIKDL